MRIHANARTCPNSRKLLVRRIEEEGWSLMVAAEAAGISERSARKWLGRWRAEGEAGLLDRSSAPRRIPHRTPVGTVEAIGALRRLRMTAAEIAETLGLALSTVSLWLKKIGLGKRSRLQPPEPPNRYERSRPGELIHVDVKKLGRFGVAGKRAVGNRSSSRGYGWECCHVCIDDATRLAYVEVLPDERGETSSAFLRRAVAWFAERGVKVERVMTDNGSPYRSEWAYGRLYGSSIERRQALPGWLDRYNCYRKHGSLGHRSPVARLSELLGNNLVGNYS
jgi:transposase